MEVTSDLGKLCIAAKKRNESYFQRLISRWRLTASEEATMVPPELPLGV
jgi:hypothetical protein